MTFHGSSLPVFLFFLTDHLLATSDNLMLIVSSFNSPNNPVFLISKHLLLARKSLVHLCRVKQARVHQRFSSQLQMPLFQYHSPLPAVASYMRQLPRSEERRVGQGSRTRRWSGHVNRRRRRRTRRRGQRVC